MARIRSIKPEFFLNDELAALGPYSQLLFAGLWTQADREGRLSDRPARLKAALLPYYDLDVNDLLDELADAGFIERYEIAGKTYIQVTAFLTHQCPNVKESPSTIPAPCQHDTSTPLIGREGKEGKGREHDARDEKIPASFSELPECFAAHEFEGRTFDSLLYESCERNITPTWVMNPANRSKLARWIREGCPRNCNGECAAQCAEWVDEQIVEFGPDSSKHGLLSARLRTDPRGWAE